MKALIQRVSSAKVEVDSATVGEINQGLLVFIGIEKNDEKPKIDKMIKRLLSYRVFYDEDGKMDLSVTDVDGGILVVSQFTLTADTNSGTRPGFSTAKLPAEANILYEYFLTQISQQHGNIQSGKFGADMQVSLTNDGPVTFLLTC
ncbi:D-aminoacyl-tRNA deacylase (EC 3.1.1.96) [uncultured Gammaproteobacteria bacterium]|uniref:D-aminoacyl-tRNA deacylase n=1 Tax=Bathymodiolus heckerae thiotrophic gill symbiont TaxID=1052212 RepID=UPI0010BA8A67|nr:D-aminoacyl-tRNA deacylase [Bathymodiolus heckerae thiotrophic gill symbiont]CAC9536320.1 D-aminoacyl-tRNA deacylase (EC 3.1.1.96) [uncultured Gammaproteobacteria bacterium]CAC9952247.1 D-aminoacyl-tRNA deacylase (EC 3.1.1.96) [uncultured Gammaproteobacteria bacterium]CAC9961492.1 D-aminoacyl-tRNA deacylase (EC 3.1.1.96) [uncultured Gammaproteobacteria bacterium]SHN89280.1 D-tyrosyl-tRNA(Tyr) deacylase (EC 3.6.1.n1) [Bathymodiolus heckerae thiotrophic gill symbiont]